MLIGGLDLVYFYPVRIGQTRGIDYFPRLIRDTLYLRLILPNCTIAPKAVIARKGEETDAVPQIQGRRYRLPSIRQSVGLCHVVFSR
jgi:hypothetical protein